jgi:hypothetical protein
MMVKYYSKHSVRLCRFSYEEHVLLGYVLRRAIDKLSRSNGKLEIRTAKAVNIARCLLDDMLLRDCAPGIVLNVYYGEAGR